MISSSTPDTQSPSTRSIVTPLRPVRARASSCAPPQPRRSGCYKWPASSPARVYVRDIIDKGSPVVVSERRGSEQLVRHEVIVGRIADYGAERQFEGSMLTVPVTDKSAIAAAVRRGRRQTVRALQAGEEAAGLLRMASGGAMVMEVIDLFDRPQPKVTVDGEEMAFADTIFSVLDTDEARRALDRAPELEREDAESCAPDELARYAWLEERRENGSGPTRILGAVILGRKSLRSATW